MEYENKQETFTKNEYKSNDVHLSIYDPVHFVESETTHFRWLFRKDSETDIKTKYATTANFEVYLPRSNAKKITFPYEFRITNTDNKVLVEYRISGIEFFPYRKSEQSQLHTNRNLEYDQIVHEYKDGIIHSQFNDINNDVQSKNSLTHAWPIKLYALNMKLTFLITLKLCIIEDKLTLAEMELELTSCNVLCS